MDYATYQVTPAANDNGTYYFTDCGHRMYSVLGPEAYHNKLCPGCMREGKQTVLYIRGSQEANEIMDERFKKGETK